MNVRLDYDAPNAVPGVRAWVVATADTGRSASWLDLDIRVMLQMGDYKAQKKWLDSLLKQYEADPASTLVMPSTFVQRAYNHIQEAKSRLLEIPLGDGQKVVWPAFNEVYAKMSLHELQSHCNEWLTGKIAGWYDHQMLNACFLKNQSQTYMGFGPHEIHPNAVEVPNTLKIADVRTRSHPWGRGKASQW